MKLTCLSAQSCVFAAATPKQYHLLRSIFYQLFNGLFCLRMKNGTLAWHACLADMAKAPKLALLELMQGQSTKVFSSSCVALTAL